LLLAALTFDGTGIWLAALGAFPAAYVILNLAHLIPLVRAERRHAYRFYRDEDPPPKGEAAAYHWDR
jgi:hypothetical protein